jgi:cell division protein FtsZ
VTTTVRVAVVGVGGAGVNAVSRLADVGVPDVRLVAVDTSAQTLQRAAGTTRVMLRGAARGLGTGGRQALGAAAAAEAESELAEALAGADLVFVVAGLAGGTGGGAAPAIARLARASGASTIGLAILPFAFEAKVRREAAAKARTALVGACDALVLLDNARAARLAGDAVPLDVALRVADDVLRQAVQGLSDLIGGRGWIGVDFSHVQAVLADTGYGCLALGVARGDNPARSALEAALASPLADMRALERARGVLVQVTGGEDLGVRDVADAIERLRTRLAPGCHLVVGVGHEPVLAGAAQVTLLGTGVPETAALGVPERVAPTAAAGHRALRPVLDGRRPVALNAPVRQAV